MHKQLELIFGGAVILAVALGSAACSRGSERAPGYPQARPVPVHYVETDKPPNASMGKAGVGYDSMNEEEGAPLPSSSSRMDNGAYDYTGVPNTSSLDNVPTGIGGGPRDVKPAAPTNDDGDALKGVPDPKSPSDTAKPQGGGTSKSTSGKPSTGKGGTTGSGAPTGPTGGTSGSAGGGGAK